MPETSIKQSEAMELCDLIKDKIAQLKNKLSPITLDRAPVETKEGKANSALMIKLEFIKEDLTVLVDQINL